MSTIAQSKPADAILVIEQRAKAYAHARENLGGYVADFEAELAALRRKHLPVIKRSAAWAANHQAELQREIEAHPDLFVKPRTMTLHGIKLGFQKGKGKLILGNIAKLIERIRAQFPKAKADLLIKVTQTPMKKALSMLPADELKKLGITVETTGDAVFIEAIDTEVDKLVARLLDEGSKTEES